MFHGLFLIIERLDNVKNLTLNIKAYLGDVLFKIASHCYLLLLITVSWVFFRSDTLEQSTQIIKNMFLGNDNYLIGTSYLLSHKILILILPIAILVSMPFNSFIKNRFSFSNRIGRMSMILLLAINLLISITLIGSNSYNPFIYFQF